jgi:hypothetical protein
MTLKNRISNKLKTIFLMKIFLTLKLINNSKQFLNFNIFDKNNLRLLSRPGHTFFAEESNPKYNLSQEPNFPFSF